MTFRQNFIYHVPMYGNIEVDGPDPLEEDVIKLIEQTHPEALDIELLGIEKEMD